MQESPRSDHGYTFLSETPRTSRRPSMSNDIPAFSSTISSAPLPRDVNPPPAYVAVAAASQIVSDYYKSQLQRRFGEEVAAACPDDATLFSDGALVMVNAFLDYLLYQFLATSRSTSLQSLRTAVQEVLKPKLAREALASAEEELQELLAGGEDEDEQLALHDGSEHGDKWDLGMVWKRSRLRIMVYTRLGEMEDEDEERYVEQEQLFRPQGAERRFSSTSGPVSWAAAIFLTSVIEYLAEQTLLVAGHAAYDRAVWKKLGKSQMIPPTAGRLGERVVVEEFDTEKIALNSTLGRLWRTWRKRLRTPAMRASSPSSRASTYRASSNLFSSRLSAGTTEDSIYSQNTRSRQSSLAGNSELGTVEQQRIGTNTNRVDRKSGDSVYKSNKQRETGGRQQKAGRMKRAQSHAAFQSSSDEGITSVSPKSVISKTSSIDPRSMFRSSGRHRSSSLPSPEKTPIASPSEQQIKDVATPTPPNTSIGDRRYSSQRWHLKIKAHQRVAAGVLAEAASLTAAAVANPSGPQGAQENSSSLRVEREKTKSGISTVDATADEEEPEVLESVRVALESPGTPTEVVQTISRTSSNARSFPLRPTSPTKPSENSGLARYRGSSGYTGRSSTSSEGYILRPNSSPRPGSSQGEYFEKHTSATSPRERQAEGSKTLSRLGQLVTSLRSEQSGPTDEVALPSPSRSAGATSPDGSLASRAVSSSARKAQELSPVEEIVSLGSSPAALPILHSDGRTILQSPLAASFSANVHMERSPTSLPTDPSSSLKTSSANTEIRSGISATESDTPSAGPTGRTVNESEGPTVHGSLPRDVKTYLNYRPSEDDSLIVPTPTTDVGRAGVPNSATDSQTIALSSSHDTSGIEALLSGDLSRRPNKEVTSQQQMGPKTDAARHHRPSPPAQAVGVNHLASRKTPVSIDAQPGVWSERNLPTAASMGAWPWSRSPPAQDPINESPVGTVGTAREPTTRAESMRDFADFIRTTGPDRGQVITPLSNPSQASLKGSTSTGTVSLQERRRPSGQSLRNQTGQRSGSPDKVPPVPSVQRKFQPRDPTPTDGGSIDLIEFTRRGPPGTSEKSHLPHQHDTVETTRNAEEVNAALSGRPSISNVRLADAHSVSSARESPLVAGSLRAFENSRTVLLPSITDHSVAQPAYASPNSKALAMLDPHGPVRTRRRIKDPYQFDTDDEDDDFLTALPKSRAGRQEESLMDFLRDVEPPSAGVNAKSRSIGNGNVSRPQTEVNGASPADPVPQSRSSYSSASRPMTAAKIDSVETIRASHTPFLKTISSVPAAPQGTGNEQWSKSVTSLTNKPKYLARSAGARDARVAGNGTVSTAELVDFFRNSEPPSTERAPAPVVKSERDSTSMKSAKSSRGTRGIFWKKKTYLDMP